VMKRVDQKKLRVLSQVGAHSRQAMKRQIRPAKKRDRIVDVGGRQCYVPQYGKVIDNKTKEPVSKAMADKARRIVFQRLKSEGIGKPPRRGPTDLLRKFIFFGVEKSSESVVIGPMAFKSQ